jgi:Short C-terminal domain
MFNQNNPLKGRGFTVWIEEDDILIKYGVMYYGFLGTKRVPVTNITTTNWKDPGSSTVGFLEINILGEAPPSPMASPNVQNQNKLSFEKSELESFVAFRDWIQSKIKKPNAHGTANISVADEIAKLAGLLGDGHITQSEFDAQKAKLLGL